MEWEDIEIKTNENFRLTPGERSNPRRLEPGHLPDAQRRDMIDAALGYFSCLGEDDQRGYAAKNAELLRQREGVNGTRGNESTQPPTGCRRVN
jgi:hypothetical protein